MLSEAILRVSEIQRAISASRVTFGNNRSRTDFTTSYPLLLPPWKAQVMQNGNGCRQ